jgi:O-antigen/teichoic acid export membrane protein
MSLESKKSLLKNTLALSIPSAVNPFVSLALVYVVSRKLGVEGMGQYSLLLSYLNIFTTVASLGLGGLIVREVARKPEDVHTLTGNAILFGLVSSIIAMVLMDFGVTFLRYDNQLLTAFLLGSVALIPASCSRFLESSFRAIEKSEFIAFGQFMENVSKVILCTAVVLTGYGIVAISAMTVLTKLLALGLLLVFYFKVVGVFSIRFKKDVWAMLLKEAPTFMGIAIFSTIHLNVDMILLSKLAGVLSVGIYGAALRINQMCVIIPMAFSLAILPIFSRHFGYGLESLREKTELSIRYVLIVCLPMAIGMILLADKVIFLIYGHKFAQSVFILQLMAPSLIPYSLVLILAQTLIAANYQGLDMKINLVAAAMATALNYILIQRFAEIGAVMANIITIVVFVILQLLFVTKNLFPVQLVQISKKPLLAATGMAFVTYLLREFNMFLNIVISAVAYFALLFCLKGLYPEEIATIKSVGQKIGQRSFNYIRRRL